MPRLFAVLILSAGVGFFACGGSPASGPAIRIVGRASRADADFFRDFYAAMMKAVEEKDVEASLSFYSAQFKGEDERARLRDNIALLYRNYRNPVYAVEQITLTVGEDTALTEDVYSYSALPQDSSSGLVPLDFKGRERIYWIREDGGWKIRDWVYF